MDKEHILIVEDEEKIGRVLEDYLAGNGYGTSYIDNGDEVLPFVRSNAVDLILLDIMLPGMDGLAVCSNIRKFSRVPIIFITARVEEVDALLGLELGSDDYIRKPFRPREVVARVKAVLRRAKALPVSRTAIGIMMLDEEEHRITIQGVPMDLTPNEFGILAAFIKRPSKVYTRSELTTKVQGYTYDGYERNIDTHVKNLRKKLALALPNREVIKSVYGVGYQINPSQLD
ncbi:response regulator [Desulfobacter vibrioformis]|uniref:response regulator n=1 Tax=Desulfobacter vibrioformis TaxID=34031 RepID=UPI000550E88F|nr:response regulator [Desulfobacter vibrioformis]